MFPEQRGVESIHRPDRRVSRIFRVGYPALIVSFDIFHRPGAFLDAALHSSECFSFFSQRFRMQSYDDPACAPHDEPLAQKVESMLRFEGSGFIGHYQTSPFQVLPDHFPGFLHRLPIMRQNQKVVVVPDVFSADALDLMIQFIQQGYLVELVDL